MSWIWNKAPQKIFSFKIILHHNALLVKEYQINSKDIKKKTDANTSYHIRSKRFLIILLKLLAIFYASKYNDPTDHFEHLHSVQLFEVLSNFVWCIITFVNHRFWFSGDSEVLWKNDSQLGSFKLEELTKVDFWVFDIRSEFWWFR